MLNSCADAGMRVKFAHGAGVTREGCVMPLKGGRWEARMFAADPLSPPPDPAGDGLDD